MAQAKLHIERATDGLAPEAAIEHLEAAVEQAAVQASRLGFQFPATEPPALAVEDGQVPVVVVQPMGGAETA